MLDRLTVSQLFTSQQPTIVRQNCSISTVFFTDEHIYLIETTLPNIMKQMSLKNFKITQMIQLPQNIVKNKIISLTEVNGFIVFALEKCNDLWYISPKRQILKAGSHLQPINKVIDYRNGIATCSDDFTVRIWSIQKERIIQSRTKHVYFGHSGKVICLEKCQDILVSGSVDFSVIFWRKDQPYCSFKSNSPIVNLLPCSQSNQFLVFSQSGQISVLNWAKIFKHKKTEVNRVIKYVPEKINEVNNCFTHCNEVDDSFVWFSDGTGKIIFLEVNLGEIIIKKDILEEQSQGRVVNMKSIGRMLLYGKENDGLYLLRF